MTTITPTREFASVLSTEHMVAYLGSATVLDALHRSWVRLFLAAGRAAVTSLRYDTLFPLIGIPAFAAVVSTYDQFATCFATVTAGKASLAALQGTLQRYLAARGEAVDVLRQFEQQLGHDVAAVVPLLAPQVTHLIQEWLATAAQIPDVPAALPQHITLVQGLMGTLAELSTAANGDTTQTALDIDAMLAFFSRETDGGHALTKALAQVPAPPDLITLVARAGSILQAIQAHTVRGSRESAVLYVTAVGDLALAYCRWGKGLNAPAAARSRAALATLALQEPIFRAWLAQQEATAIIGYFCEWPDDSPVVTYLSALMGTDHWHVQDGHIHTGSAGQVGGPMSSTEVVFLPDWANELHAALLTNYDACDEGGDPITAHMVRRALAGGQSSDDA